MPSPPQTKISFAPVLTARGIAYLTDTQDGGAAVRLVALREQTTTELGTLPWPATGADLSVHVVAAIHDTGHGR